MPAVHGVYPALARFRLELPEDAVIHEAGIVPASFHVLVSGAVILETIDGRGTRSVVGTVRPGGLVGVESAFSGFPTEALARTTERSVVLAVPVSAAALVFQAAPELAVTVVRWLASRGVPASEEPAVAAPAAAAPSTPQGKPAPVGGLESFDERSFFSADMRCPACVTTFACLQVRMNAVRPAGRDSDFRITYESVDPTWYAVTVCPRCAYASYHEDFTELTDQERRTIVETTPARTALLTGNLSGERTPAEARLSLVLAQMCAESRGASLRRRAGLLHRLTWMERAAGNAEAERELLQQTRDAYREVFERDPDVQDAAAVRVLYLIGDLSLRLGDPATARRWLLECVRLPAGREQMGLITMARQRLEDANEALGLKRSA